MFFKQNWCLAVLLLIIILIFSFFSEYRKNVFDTKVAIYEGLQNNDQNDSSNNTVVASSDSAAPVSGECSMVPACYDTVLDDNTLFQSQNNSDKYMLKSQMVPPVCPACPEVKACPRKEQCPPCPPCARCPEPSFECKKVPNYSSKHNDSLPRPVLADFSQFGM